MYDAKGGLPASRGYSPDRDPLQPAPALADR